MSIATVEADTVPSVYACTQPRTTTALTRVHSDERHQPRDLRTAVRWLFTTQTHKLMLALAYLNGHAKDPVRISVSGIGYRTIDDGHSGRIFQVAAAITMIEDAGLDPNVVMALRGAYVSDGEVFAILACGTDKKTAHDYWFDPSMIPDVRTMLTMGVLRGVDVSPTTYDD